MTNEPPNNGDQPPPPVTATAVLQIMLMPNGTVEVSGPIDNRLVAYGLLMMAHDRLKDYYAQKDSGGLIALPPGVKLRKA